MIGRKRDCVAFDVPDAENLGEWEYLEKCNSYKYRRRGPGLAGERRGGGGGKACVERRKDDP